MIGRQPADQVRIADHAPGALLERGRGSADAYPTLRFVYSRLKAFEARRIREIERARGWQKSDSIRETIAAHPQKGQ
jgi:hypothetical protein